MSGGNLVSETLRGDDGNLIADSLVRFEVESELWVIPLNDHLGGLFDGLHDTKVGQCNRVGHRCEM